MTKNKYIMTLGELLLGFVFLFSVSPANSDSKELFDKEFGAKGVWIRNESAEAFIVAEPYPRIAAFRMIGGESPFNFKPGYHLTGIRTWFIETDDHKLSGQPSMKAAEFHQITDRSLRIVSEPEPQSKLQLHMEISLDEKSPVMTILHSMKNIGDKERRISIWPLMVFGRRGLGIAPWSIEPTEIRSLLFFLKTDPNEDMLKYGSKALALDFSSDLKVGQLKVGIPSDAGWGAYIWNGGILKSHVEIVGGAEYPDRGATVIFYACGHKPEGGQCELEHTGPVSSILPGASLSLTQRLELFPPMEKTGECADTIFDSLNVHMDDKKGSLDKVKSKLESQFQNYWLPLCKN